MHSAGAGSACHGDTEVFTGLHVDTSISMPCREEEFQIRQVLEEGGGEGGAFAHG